MIKIKANRETWSSKRVFFDNKFNITVPYEIWKKMNKRGTTIVAVNTTTGSELNVWYSGNNPDEIRNDTLLYVNITETDGDFKFIDFNFFSDDVADEGFEIEIV